jgi:hypothetical protein
MHPLADFYRSRAVIDADAGQVHTVDFKFEISGFTFEISGFKFEISNFKPKAQHFRKLPIASCLPPTVWPPLPSAN